MDEHICHHGDTLQHRDVVGCHREAQYAASQNFINEPKEAGRGIQTRHYEVQQGIDRLQA